MAIRQAVSALARELVTRVPKVGATVARASADAVRARLAAGATVSALTVDVVTEEVAWSALAADWTALFAASGARSAFASWPWLSSWWRHIGATRGALHVYVAREAGRTIAIAPTYRVGAQLRTLGDTWVGSEHLDLLAAPDCAARSAAAVARAIAEDPRLTSLELVDLVEGSALERALGAEALVGAQRGAWQTLPYLPLPGSSARWEASLSSNMRYNVRRKLKRLEKAYPRVQLTWLDRAAALPDALERLFSLHAARWATKGQTGNFVRPEVRAFHHAAAPGLLAAGLLRLYALEVEPGRVAAMLYCLRSGGRELYLQAGLDPALEELSGGFCLMAHVIARAADDGMTEFDFLRGTEAYKTHWATASRTTRRLWAARATLAGVGATTAEALRVEGVAAVKAALPAPWLARLRKLGGG